MKTHGGLQFWHVLERILCIDIAGSLVSAEFCAETCAEMRNKIHLAPNSGYAVRVHGLGSQLAVWSGSRPGLQRDFMECVQGLGP